MWTTRLVCQRNGRTSEASVEVLDDEKELEVKSWSQLGTILVETVQDIRSVLMQQNRHLERQNILLVQLVDLKTTEAFGGEELVEEEEDVPEEELAELATERRENSGWRLERK